MSTLNRRSFLGAAAAAGAAAQTQRDPVNVVFFMTDDHGAWATGAYGCDEMHTPRIDELASSGTLFSRAFACTPVCSPSRATYYTGKLPSHHGVQDFLMGDDTHGPKSHRFLEGHTTFAEVLKSRGYATGLIGKWHLGEDTTPQSGYDYWCTAPRGGGRSKDLEFTENGRSVTGTGYKTDFIGSRAADFIERNRNRPFCLTVPFFAPHTPYDYQPEKYRRPYRDASFSCFPEPPQHPQRRGRHDRHWANREAKIGYSALVTAVDANVGRVMDRLEELGVAGNTVVIFTADHGYNCGHHGFWGKGNGTLPFNMYEESIQVPLIWYQPGTVPAGLAPAPMVSSYDFFPTLLDHLGIQAEPDRQRVGRSYAAFLRGEQPDWPTELYYEFAYVRSIRTRNYKLVERTEGWGDEFFDLEADPGEQINRIGAPRYQEHVAALRRRLHQFFDEAGAPPLADWRSTTRQNLPMDVDGYYRWKE
ncbi:MAG: sulfatase-like hydrolase/transferase [bacterium]|nr:sulfatase-like hydrolase/transferase [bacterium]